MANDNTTTFEKAIEFIGSGDVVVTNSYHGAYWGLLLGKKVEMGDPLKSRPSPKTKYLKWDITLEEARHINIQFYDRIMNYLEEQKPAELTDIGL